MDVVIWVVVIVLVFVLALTFLSRRAVLGVDPTQLLLDPELVGRVRALAQANQKVRAIKVLRDGTPGLSLASAKVMVDRMTVQTRATDRPDLRKPQPDSPETSPSAATVPLEIELQARSLKSDGRAIQAIKLVRQQTSWGLREAKDYVDRL